MIKVKFILNSNTLNTIEVIGHANFAEKGNDIVCSAVSAILYTCLNSLKSLNKKDIEIKDGYCKILNLQNIDEHDKTVIEVFKNGMEMISDEYSKNLKIIYEEKWYDV